MTNITAFIPTYNRAKYLRKCLEALKRQDADLRVIVSDNASSDDTPRVVEDSPLDIAYSRNPENIGLVGNFNRVLDLCETEFVVLLPDDVLLAPGFIRSAVDSLSRHREATMYATAALVTNPSIHAPASKVLMPPVLSPSSLWAMDPQEFGHEAWAASCAFRPPIYTGAAAFRMSFLREAMPWREDQIANADRLTYFGAGRKGTVLFDPWVGAHAIYDGHNYGNTIAVNASRAEYRAVTQHIIETARRDGVDVLGYWRRNIGGYSRQDQKEILASARFALLESAYRETFGGVRFTPEVRGGRLERYGVPEGVRRALRALRS